MENMNLLVGAIPVCKNSILLTQRSTAEKFMPGAWGIPAGKVKNGEKLENATLRELKEETGLDGKIKKQAGVSEFFSSRNEVKLYNLQINFLVEVNEMQPINLDKSTQSYKWISIDTIHLFDLDDFTFITIKQAIEIKG